MKEIKEMSVPEKVEIYRVAGKCPAVAWQMGQEQGLSKYKPDTLRHEYARRADTIFQLHFQTKLRHREGRQVVLEKDKDRRI